MKLPLENFPVADLIEMVNKGGLALPEFQRDFIWKPPDVAELLRTVARQWPAGTFLLLKADGGWEWEMKPITGAPDTDSPSLLVLDGQQRMTALFHAFEEQSPEIYYVDMRALSEAEDFEDEHLRFLKKSKFFATYPTTAAMADSGIANVATINDDVKFLQWCQHLGDNDEQVKMMALRQERLPGLKSYDIPAVLLSKENAPLAALAKIFETINRRGIRLDTFDLMVAKLYPHGFKLRDEWDEARTTCPAFVRMKVAGIDVLRLLALREHLRQREAGTPLTVKGIRQSDVLSLTPEVVKDGWPRALEGLAAALTFLEQRVGVIRSDLLMTTMLLPLSDILMSTTHRGGYERDLERWYWCSVFAQTYAQGANTQAVADARSLRAWMHDPASVPAVVGAFNIDEVRESLRDSRRRNDLLLSGVLALLTLNDARDWKSGERIREYSVDVDLQAHHIFADRYLKNIGVAERDVVANFAYISRATNASLRNDAPSTVLANSEVDHAAVQSHRIDLNRMIAQDWQGFIDARVLALEVLINSAVSA